MKKLHALAVSSMLGLTLSSNASATTFTFDVNAALNGDPATHFASLVFDDVLSKFTLNFLDTASSLGSSAFIDFIAVDYNFSLNQNNRSNRWIDRDDEHHEHGNNRKIHISDVTGGVSRVRFIHEDTPRDAYDFLFKIGNGRNRLVAGETVSWISDNFNMNNLGTSDSPFAIHLRGITGGENTSGWFTLALLSPVPEPESYALMLTGIGIMGLVARRHRNLA